MLSRGFKVLSWSKNGWVDDRSHLQFPLSCKLGIREDEFNKSKHSSSMRLINEVQNEVQIQSPGVLIDKLPLSLRDLYQQSYDWYIASNKMFRINDPIEQPQWGTDTFDKEFNILSEDPSILRLLLNKAELIVTDTAEEVINLVKNIEELLPELPKDILIKLSDIISNYEKSISSLSNEIEKETLSANTENELDQIISGFLTIKLDSEFCGKGYIEPPKKFTPSFELPESDIQEAAKRREETFYNLFSEAASCTSMTDLYGNVVYDTVFGNKRSGGFCGSIRELYRKDKELRTKWSLPNPKSDNQSAFEKDKISFIYNWRKNNIGDEEQLRKALKIYFDKTAMKFDAKYDENGVLVRPTRRRKDSIWYQARTKAFTELCLTANQWKLIYKMVDIVKSRIKMKKDNEFREKSIELLSKHFKRITCLQDLNDFTKWAYKRHLDIKKGTLKPSKIDFISFADEQILSKSCARLRRHLERRIVLYTTLSRSIINEEDTSIELSLPCPYVNKSGPCNCMTITNAKFFEIREGLGLLGIRCEGCNKVIFNLGYKDKPTLKTKKELKNEYQSNSQQ